MASFEKTSSRSPHRLACVSFLNSKPLIDPLVGRSDVDIHFAVPSKLMDLVEAGTVSTALMSVVDFQLCPHDLLLVPAGMIGCDGPTLTVRIFSRVPPEKIHSLHGDTDSHTSVMLAQVILRERYNLSPVMHPWRNTEHPETLLLIGDKVVNAAPSTGEYPYQLDLGEEWKKLTGLPFVFAMWMMRKDNVDLELARMLADARRRGADITDELVVRHADEHGWPRDLARRYFTEYLRYEVTPRAREGLARFFDLAERLSVLPIRRPVEYLEVE
jgi:chorismate dehydratase